MNSSQPSSLMKPRRKTECAIITLITGWEEDGLSNPSLDLGLALGLYSADQLMSPHFDQYMDLCDRSPTNDTSFSGMWEILGRGPYKGSK